MKALLLLLFLCAWALHAAETTIIYDGTVSKLDAALPEQDNLWLTSADLTRASRFVLKPEGACLDELCVPIPKSSSCVATVAKTTSTSPSWRECCANRSSATSPTRSGSLGRGPRRG